MRLRLEASRLLDIADRLEAGERLSFDDGVRLFEAPDLLAVGWLANRERERRHADQTFFNQNIRIEATNVCVASCLFCAFARLKPGDPGAYTMSLEQAWDKIRDRQDQALTEVHVVNGLHPDLPFSYYIELLQGFTGCPTSGFYENSWTLGLTHYPVVELKYLPKEYGGRLATISVERSATSRFTGRYTD